MKRALLIILGMLLSLVGVVCVTGGVLIMTIVGSDGVYSSDLGKVNGNGYALLFNKFSVDTAGNANVEDFADLTAGATSTNGQQIFMGIAPTSAVAKYLSGVSRDVVSDITQSSAKVVAIPGTSTPLPPASQSIWIEQAQGVSPTLKVGAGEGTTLVIMNVSPSAPVAVTMSVGVSSAILFPSGIGFLVAGVVLLLLALWCFLGARRVKRRRSAPVPLAGPVVPASPISVSSPVAASPAAASPAATPTSPPAASDIEVPAGPSVAVDELFAPMPSAYPPPNSEPLPAPAKPADPAG